MAVYLICYGISFILAWQHLYVLSGLVLVGAAVWLYIRDYIRTGNLIHLRGLFCLFFVGGQGISCFKLSYLQTDWLLITWISFFLAVMAFWWVFEVLTRLYDGWSAADMGSVYKYYSSADSPLQANRILISMAVITLVSILAFAFEAWRLGFVPMFSYGVPHAYSYFHISGVHYFTISCILIPALTVLYTKVTEKISGRTWILLIAGNLTAVAIPILCVSRFQLLFAVGFAAVMYLMLYKKITWKMIVTGLLIMIPVYVLLTVARRHNVTYLNGIFEMKNSKMPIFITQPYIYVANNFENFNCMVEQLTAHTWGLQMLFPFFALTGLKFVFPQLVTIPDFVTKTELTTLTMFYDAYYDFGIIGTALFAFIIGLTAAAVSILVRQKKNPMTYMFYGQIAIYLGLAFFTTWFSNPTTWFWLALTLMMYWFVGYRRKGKGSHGRK